MHVMVVYESIFGNTRQVAEAVAEGAREAGQGVDNVALLTTSEAGPGPIDDADLLFVGAPTHALGLSNSRSRGQGLRQGKGDPVALPARDALGQGAREWLAQLGRAGNRHGRARRAAAFDTRLAFPVAGGAARPIARRLRRSGFAIVSRPQGFIVDGARGPLRAGELERAKSWARELVADAFGYELPEDAA